MNCPVCGDAKLQMTDRQGIEIDYCPDCRGVWLDRGELDKIIERSTQELQQAGDAPDRGAPDAASESGHGKKKKKRSFLSELFEMGELGG